MQWDDSEWIRRVTFFGIGRTWACFHEVGNVPRVYEIWNSLLRIGEISGAQVFEDYCWNTIRAFGLGGVKLEKGLADFSCGERNE